MVLPVHSRSKFLFLDVSKTEFSILFRLVDAFEEALSLLLFRDVR